MRKKRKTTSAKYAQKQEAGSDGSLPAKRRRVMRRGDHARPNPKATSWKTFDLSSTEARLAQDALRETRRLKADAEDLQANLFDLAPVGYLMLNEAGCILNINLVGARLLGRSRERLTRQPLLYFIARPDRQKYLRHLALCQQRPGNQLSTELWLNPDYRGRAVCVEFISQVPAGADSAAPTYNSVLIDISRRKEAEAELRSAHNLLEHRVQERTAQLVAANQTLQAEIKERTHIEQVLRESEERLRLLIKESRDCAVFMLDAEGRIAPYNAGAEQIEGYLKKEISGRHISCLYPREDVRNGRPDRLLKTARNKGRAEDEGWLIRKNGSRFWGNIVATAVYDDKGRMRGYSNVARDLSERRHTQEVLRLSEQNLADFFNYAPFGLLWVGPRGEIRRVNKAGLEILGCKAEHCLQKRLQDFYAHPEMAKTDLKRLAQHEALEGQRAQLRRPDGKIRHVLIDANGLWEKGRMQHTRWFVRDITRRVELEREILRIAEREQQRLGQDLHDDLCQQLTGIEYFSQTLAGQLSSKSVAGAQRAREIARLVRQSITHTRELAHGLAPVDLEAYGLAQALQELAERTRKLFNVDCRFRSRHPAFNRDPARGIHFYRIAQEAVSNALKHGHARRVGISLKHSQNRLQLTVKDDGTGLPAKPRNGRSLGLRLMQYRAGVINGTLTFKRNSNGGTTLTCTVSDAPENSATNPSSNL